MLAAPSNGGPDAKAASGPRLCIATGRYLRSGETFVNRHIERLFGGNTVVVCGRRTGQDSLGKPVFSRLRAVMNPADLVLAPWHLLQNYHRYRAPFVPFGMSRRQLVAFLEGERVDAVLAEFGSQAVSIWPVCKAMGIPVFSYFRGRDASRYLQSASRVEGYRRMMPNLAGVFAVSQFLLDNLAAQGLSHPNAYVVPSGTDVAAFSPGEKTPGQMLFVGRFVEKKAPKLTLESFLAIAPQHPHARLDMVGDGPLLNACKALAASSGLGDRVVFHGRQSSLQVRAHLSRADIFVLHSVTGQDGETEGLPSAIQEAMAAGAATLSTRHAGIPELVEQGVSGILVDEMDASGMREGMHAMLADPVTTRQMGVRARETALERVDYRRLYQKVETVIRQQIDANSGAKRG